MNQRVSFWIKTIGIVNMVLGIIPSLFLLTFLVVLFPDSMIIIPLFTLAGWVTDRSFTSFMDWFMLTIINRGSLIFFYMSSLFLFWSGLKLFKKIYYSRQLTIISSCLAFLSWLAYDLTSIIHTYLYRRDLNFNISALSIDLYISIILLIYTFLIIKYLTSVAVKKEFVDTSIRYLSKRTILIILFTLVVIFIPYFWLLLTKLIELII